MTRFGLQRHSRKKVSFFLSSLTAIRCKEPAIYAIRDFCEKGRGQAVLLLWL
jgi:hypothetical protein